MASTSSVNRLSDSETRPQRARVFLSYTRADRDAVELVAEELRERQIDLWFDEWHLSPGDDFVREIERAMRSSSTVLLFVSKASLKSKRVREEHEIARGLESVRGSKLKLIPVRLDRARMPEFLRSRVFVDLSSPNSLELAKLVQSVVGERGMLEIDRTVGRISKEIVQMDPKSLRAKWHFDDCLGQIDRIARDRRMGAKYSAVALAESFPMSSSTGYTTDRRTQKWLGNTNRDYLQCLLFAGAAKILRSDNRLRRMTVKRLLVLLEATYGQLRADLAEYGLASQRDADFYIASDVERLFEIVLTHALKPTPAIPVQSKPSNQNPEAFDTVTPAPRKRRLEG